MVREVRNHHSPRKENQTQDSPWGLLSLSAHRVIRLPLPAAATVYGSRPNECACCIGCMGNYRSIALACTAHNQLFTFSYVEPDLN